MSGSWSVVVRFLPFMAFSLISLSLKASPNIIDPKKRAALPALESCQIFAEGLNQQDTESLTRIVDSQKISETIADLAFDNISEDERQSFLTGVKAGLSDRMFKNWFVMLEKGGGRAWCRRVLNIDNEERGLVYIDFGEEGMTFIELMRDKKTGKLIDMYPYTTGENLTQTVASLVSLMMPEKSGFFSKLMGLSKPDKKLLDAMNEVNKHNRVGAYDKSFAVLSSLPENLQNSRILLGLKVQFASSVSDEEYAKQLTILDKLYGNDPRLFFILMDHYLFTEQYDRALSGLDKLEQRIQKDGAISYLKAIMHYTKGDYSRAVDMSKEAISLEPGIDDYWWFLVATQNSAQAFDAMVATLDRMRDELGFEFYPDEYLKDPDFEKFTQSKAFKSWRVQWDERE